MIPWVQHEKPPRPLWLAAGVGALALSVVYAGFIVQNLVHDAAPQLAPPALSIAALLYVAFTRRIVASSGLGPRARPVTALLTAAAAPIFGALAHLALAVPIVKVRDGRDPAFIGAAGILVVVLCASILIAGIGAGALLRRPAEAIARPLGIAASTTVAAAILLAAAAAISPRPSLGRWIDALPVALHEPVPQVLDASRTVAGDRAVVWDCRRTPCGVWLVGSRERAERAPDVRADASITLHRDEARGLWILDGSPGSAPRFLDRSDTRAAFRAGDGARVALRPGALAGSASPPLGWTIVAAIGAGLALRALSRRRALREELDEIRAAEDGVLDADGWITLADGAARLRARGDVAPGPVTVVLAAPPGGPAYRSEGARAADRVLPGARAEKIGEAILAIASVDARALAIAAVTAAPLLTAWIEGLR